MAKKGSGKSSSLKQGNHVHNSFQGLNRDAVAMLEDRIGRLEGLLQDASLDDGQKEELARKVGAAKEAVKKLKDMYEAYDRLRGRDNFGTDSHAAKESKVILEYLEKSLGPQDQKGGDFNSLAFSHCQRVLLKDMLRSLNQPKSQYDSAVDISLDCLIDNSVDPIALLSNKDHYNNDKSFIRWNNDVADAKQAYREAFREALMAVNNAAAYAGENGLSLFNIDEPKTISGSIDRSVKIAPGYKTDFSKSALERNQGLLSHLQTRNGHPRLEKWDWLLDVDTEGEEQEQSNHEDQPGLASSSSSSLNAPSDAKKDTSWRDDVSKQVREVIEAVRANAVADGLEEDAAKIRAANAVLEHLKKVQAGEVPSKDSKWLSDQIKFFESRVKGFQVPSPNSTVSTSSSSAADGEGDVDVADTELAEPSAQNSEDRDIADIRNATENHGESADTPGILKASPPVGESSSAAAGVPSPLPVPPAAELSLPRQPEIPDPGEDSLPGPSPIPGRAPKTVAEVLDIAYHVAGADRTLNHVAGVLMTLAEDNPDFRNLANEALDQVLRQALMLDASRFAAGSGVAAGSDRSAFSSSSSSSSSSSHEDNEAPAPSSDPAEDILPLAKQELGDNLLQQTQPSNETADETTMESGLDTPTLQSSGEEPRQVDSSLVPSAATTGQSSSSSSLSGSKVGDVLQSQRAAAAARPRSLSTGNTVLDNLRSPPAGGRPRSLSAPSRLEAPQADGATSRGTGPRHT